MKQFFKFTFASMLGFFLAFVVVFLFFFFMVLGLASFSSKKAPEIKKHNVLCLNLKEDIPDRTPANPFENFDFNLMKVKEKIGLNDILANIKIAKDDKRIKGIFLDLSYVPAGMATIEEIREALIDFKTSGKFIISYSESYSQKAYYLATVSDKILLNPMGSVEFKGLSSQIMFFKGTLDKLDVEAQIIRHGKFKSAIEPFILDKMSEANREQMTAFLFSLWEHMLSNIAETRNISVDNLNIYADNLMAGTASEALANGFVDSLVYRDQFLSIMDKMIDMKRNEYAFLKMSNYVKSNKMQQVLKQKEDKIAVIYGEGDIVSGEAEDTKIASETMAKAIQKAREDENIKAIVLRVNSPGGSALASEVIWRELVLTKAVKPVVVSMGNLAASGGYYISCPADKIFANPTTITGSIGVFGMIPNMENFFKNKLGITFDGVNTNEHANFMSTTRRLSDFEKNKIQSYIEEIYDVFITHVAEGRGMTKAQVDTIGQGRVWSGIDAKRLGLIDEFGGMDAAIMEAAKLASLEEGSYSLIEYPKQKDLFEQLLSDFSATVSLFFAKKELGEETYVYYKYAKSFLEMEEVQARLPYDIIVE
ncbi:MAG TPA: signal peptide peptidase SppA [Bacteroidetes bacterium]|nr:signal peptide peptidase SppA [Bacteroidota bacterium]